MAEYIVNSENQLSESLLVAYRNERVGTQATVARVHRAIRDALAAEERFNAAIGEGGALEALGNYHAAKIAALVDSLATLRAGMVEIKGQMEALEAAVPGLFPGVTPSA